MRAETAERGLSERARLAEEAETGRSQRLADVIKGEGERNAAAIAGRADVQTDKDTAATNLERQKQQGRMAVQQLRAKTAQAVAQTRAAMASGKVPGPVAKSYGDYQDSISRDDIMHENLDAGLKGDQQAMLSLLANHLGMTMGLAKGARINQTNRELEDGGKFESMRQYLGGPPAPQQPRKPQGGDLGAAPAGAPEGATVRNRATGQRATVKGGRLIPIQ